MDSSSSRAPAENAASSDSSSATPPVAPGFDVLLNAALMHESPSGTKRRRSEKSGSAQDNVTAVVQAAPTSNGRKQEQNVADANIEPTEHLKASGGSSSPFPSIYSPAGSASTRRKLDDNNEDAKNNASQHAQKCAEALQDSASMAMALQQQQAEHRELLRRQQQRIEAERAEKARVDEYLNNGQYLNRAQAPPPLQSTFHEALLRAGSIGLSSSIYSSSSSSFNPIMNHGRPYSGAGRSGEPFSMPFPSIPGQSLHQLMPQGTAGSASGMNDAAGAPFTFQHRALLEQLQLQHEQERQRHQQQQEDHQHEQQHQQQRQQQRLQQQQQHCFLAAAAGQHPFGHPLSHPGSYSATAAYAHLLAQSQQQAHQLAHVRSLQGAPPRLVAGHPGPLPHHFSQEASFLQYMAQPRGLPLPAANGGSSSSSSGAAYPGQPYGMPMHYQPQHPPFGYPSGAQFLRGHLYGLHPPARGSTCGACARSKVKCDRIQPCARCNRLGLECAPRQKVRGAKKNAAAAASEPSEPPPPPPSTNNDQSSGTQAQSPPAGDDAAADSSAGDVTATDTSAGDVAAADNSSAVATPGDATAAGDTSGDAKGTDVTMTNGPMADARADSALVDSAQSETFRAHAVASDDQMTSTESLATLGSIQALSSQDLAYLDYHQQMELQKQIQFQKEVQRNSKQPRQEATADGMQQSLQQAEQIPPPTMPPQKLEQQLEPSGPAPSLVSTTSSTEARIEESANRVQSTLHDVPQADINSKVFTEIAAAQVATPDMPSEQSARVEDLCSEKSTDKGASLEVSHPEVMADSEGQVQTLTNV